MGVVMDGLQSRAYLEDPGTKSVFVYRVGDTVAGGRLDRITDEKVVIVRADDQMEILLGDPIVETAPDAEAAVRLSKDIEDPAEGPASPPPGQVHVARPSSGNGLADAATASGIAHTALAVDSAKPGRVVAHPAISERYRVIGTLAPGPENALYLAQRLRRLKVRDRKAVVGQRADKRTKHFVVWGGLALMAALAIWFAYARVTTGPSTVSKLLTRSAPTAEAPLSATVPVAVPAPGAAPLGPGGAPEGVNAARPPVASPPARQPSAWVPHLAASNTSSPERSPDLRTSQQPQAGPPLLPKAVLSGDRGQPVPLRRRTEGAPAAQRPETPASPWPEPSREAREAAEDPGAVIDWLLREGNGRRR